MIICDLLQKSSRILKKTSATPLLDAEVFLREAAKKSKEFILANPDFEISKSQEKKFWEMVQRRKKREPVAYIINKKEFFGLEFRVLQSFPKESEEGLCHNVLIPRPETETMAEMAIEIVGAEIVVGAENFQPLQQQINIIDVGTGSGCVIAAIARRLAEARKNIYFFAIDNNPDSLKIAKKNFKNLELNNVSVLEGDLIEPYFKYLRDPSSLSIAGMAKKNNSAKIRSPFHIILANLPYLNSEEYKNAPDDVKKYEPKSALYGGKDGLKFIKKLIAQIEKSKLENYILILEISPSQSEFLKQRGFEIKKDFFEKERFAIKNSKLEARNPN